MTSSDTPIILLHDSLVCTALWRNFPAALCEILASLHHTPHREHETQVIRGIGSFIKELSR